MKKVFIIHGFGGLPNGGWFPWLSRELAEKGIAVSSLMMPDSTNPVPKKWIKQIKHGIGESDTDTILLGHSLGVPAILRYMETVSPKIKIGGMLLVSGFISPLQPEKKESIFRKVDAFVEPMINFEKIKRVHIPTIIIHGTKDEVVPFFHAEKISEKVGAMVVPVVGGNHFSQLGEAPCYELPEALEAVLKLATTN